MEPGNIGRAIRRHWLTIAALTALGVLVAGGATWAATPTYESTSRVFVTLDAPSGLPPGELVAANNFAVQKVYSYQQVVLSPRVLEPAIEALGLEESASGLAQDLSVFVPLNTVVLEITASASDPQLAADIAATVTESFATVVTEELERPSDGGASLVRVELLQEATASTRPSGLGLEVAVVLGGLAGLFVGVVVVLARGLADRRVRTRADAVGLVEANLLTSIPADRLSRSGAVTVRDEPDGPVAAAYGRLGAQLVAGLPRGSFVAVTALSSPESATVAVANLATSLSCVGRRVLAIDGDAAKAGLGAGLGVDRVAGLTDYLFERATVADIVSGGPNPRLSVITAGPVADGERADLARLADLKEAVGTYYDIVLVVTPPILASGLGSHVVGAVDRVVLLSGSGEASKDELGAAVDIVESLDVEFLGVVITGAASSGPDADVSA